MKNANNVSNEELVERYKLTNDSDVLETLIENNKKLIYRIAIKHGNNKSFDLEDSFQDGAEGLINSIDDFDKTKGVKFITYAYPIIRSYIQKNDYSFDWRESLIFRTLAENQDKDHEEVWETVKKKVSRYKSKTILSKEFYNSVVSRKFIPIDVRTVNEKGQSMFLLDKYKTSSQDHSELYYDDALATLNFQQRNIADMLLNQETKRTIEKELNISRRALDKELKIIQAKVKERI